MWSPSATAARQINQRAIIRNGILDGAAIVASGLDTHPIHDRHGCPYNLDAILVERHGPQGAIPHEHQMSGAQDSAFCGGGYYGLMLPSFAENDVKLISVRPRECEEHCVATWKDLRIRGGELFTRWKEGRRLAPGPRNLHESPVAPQDNRVVRSPVGAASASREGGQRLWRAPSQRDLQHRGTGTKTDPLPVGGEEGRTSGDITRADRFDPTDDHRRGVELVHWPTKVLEGTVSSGTVDERLAVRRQGQQVAYVSGQSVRIWQCQCEPLR